MAEAEQRRVADVGFMPQTAEENLRAATMLKEEGNGYFKEGNLKDATTCYKHINLYLRHLDNSGGDKMGGMGKMMGGDKQDASKNLTPEQTIEVSNIMVAMNNNLSQIFMKQKKYTQVVAASSQVLTRDATNGKANYNLAKAFALIGDTDRSRTALQNCDSTDPQVQQILKRVEALEKKSQQKQKKKLAGMFDKISKQDEAEAQQGAESEQPEVKEAPVVKKPPAAKKAPASGLAEGEEFDLDKQRAAARAKAAEFAASLTPEEAAIYGAKLQVSASGVRPDTDSEDDGGADFVVGGDDDGVMLGDY